MSTITNLHTSLPSTTTLHRPLGGITGYRKLTDRSSRVCVHTFPFAMVQQLSALGMAISPGAYALADHRTAYLGESIKPVRRLIEHASDPLKAFSRDVFVVTGVDGCPFDKQQVVDLQFRFTNLAIEARLVSVVKGVSPQEPNASAAELSACDRICDDALRLLYDAGCRIFQSNCAPAADAPSETDPPPPSEEANDVESADSGPIQIGVTTVPLGAEEYELVYGDVWARGYWSGDHFIVAAGSEVRTQTNDSVNAITRARRQELFGAGVLADIPGVGDRRRLVAAVAFPSISIAAKVVCGAHTSGFKWAPLQCSRPIILGA